MLGTAWSLSVERIAPRSSATTFNPASASSLARMPPVQPSPTMTASTSFNLVAMSSSSAHVRDADGCGWKFLVAIFLDILPMHRDRAGKTDQPPARLVAVAAIDRVGEHPLHDRLVQRGPEHTGGQSIVEAQLAGGERHEHVLALLVIEPVERFAIRLAAMGIGCFDAGAIELRRRQRQLVALAREAELPWPLHVKTLALTPAAGERAVDKDVDADIGALRSEIVGGHHVVDQRLDERRFLQIQERVAWTGCIRSGGRRSTLLRLGIRRQTDGGGGGAPDHGALEKVAAA